MWNFTCIGMLDITKGQAKAIKEMGFWAKVVCSSTSLSNQSLSISLSLSLSMGIQFCLEEGEQGGLGISKRGGDPKRALKTLIRYLKQEKAKVSGPQKKHRSIDGNVSNPHFQSVLSHTNFAFIKPPTLLPFKMILFSLFSSLCLFPYFA